MAGLTALAPNEYAVCEQWEAQRFPTTQLTTTDGTALRCVYRGRWQRGPGPDFVEALLAFADRDLRRGDIEVHRRSSDWFRHGHHRDPAYNNVILHLVLHHDVRHDGGNSVGVDSDTGNRDGTTLKANGDSVPILALESYLSEPPSALSDCHWQVGAEPCRQILARRGPSYLGLLLDRAGEQRFRARAALLEADSAALGAKQALYSAFLTALGYSANRQQFRALASSLPWSELMGLVLPQPAARRQFTALALLCGSAGLLPSQRALSPALADADSDYSAALEEIWRQNSGLLCQPAAIHCNFTRTRPTNHPVRRLAGAAQYLTSLAPGDMVDNLLSLATDVPSSRLARRLRQHLLRSSKADDYWAHRYDFARHLRRPHGHFIGPNRADDIVVNVLLPFLVAYDGGRGHLADLALAAYRGQARAPANEITRLMEALLGNGPSPTRVPDQAQGQANNEVQQSEGFIAKSTVNSAQRQQGLLHLYQRYCREQRCQECPLAAG